MLVSLCRYNNLKESRCRHMGIQVLCRTSYNNIFFFIAFSVGLSKRFLCHNSLFFLTCPGQKACAVKSVKLIDILWSLLSLSLLDRILSQHFIL